MSDREEVSIDRSPHASDFVQVNGIRLHYLDWGGEGETLLFLTGMGCSAHLYDQIAPRFTDRLRVLALTRRGQGESDYPEAGYDADTLIDDIHDFLELLHIDKVILAGHSMAGLELTHFAATYPSRVIKLVYLDSASDWREYRILAQNDPLRDVQPPHPKDEFDSIEDYISYVKRIRPDLAQIWNEAWDQSCLYDLEKNGAGRFTERDTMAIGNAMRETLFSYEPALSQIKVPVLTFFATPSHLPFPEYLTQEQARQGLEFHRQVRLPLMTKVRDNFRSQVPHARVIEIPDGHHYCFMAQEELVYKEMRKFLLE